MVVLAAQAARTTQWSGKGPFASVHKCPDLFRPFPLISPPLETMNSNKTIIPNYKWASIFIEIALRAIRRVHYEYGIWGIGRQWEMDRSRSNLINMGSGIELADELSVCAAITQEFLSSPATAGLWHDEDNKGSEERYFGIEREKSYTFDTKKRVDIFVQKYVSKNGNLENMPKPSFIEAKRARLFKIDLKTNKISTRHQLKEVQDDIDLLREELKSRSDNDLIHCHLLIWGIYDRNKEKRKYGNPEIFFDELKKRYKKRNEDINIVRHQTRWLPLSWVYFNNKKNKLSQEIIKSLWITLTEVELK